MIQIGDMVIPLSDPAVIAALVGALALLVMLILILMALGAARRTARATAPLAQQMQMLDETARALGAGQQQLAGGLRTVSDAQVNSQAQLVQTMETRLAEVQAKMSETLHDGAMKSSRSLSDMQEKINEILHGSTEKTTKSLTQLQERLATIDKAQTNIEKLSGDVLSLQDILSNKQTRGAFGEIQLDAIVSKALPADAYTMQATLSNGKRADCLIHLPSPTGPIVIDAKFPLEAYEALRAAKGPAEVQLANRQLKAAVLAHITTIAEKYIIAGETAESALMFLPSEAVYAELHANFGDVVRAGFSARVWIVSPTTCMAVLNTMRAVLKDARMREQAGAIRRELGLLHKDVDRLGIRVGKLDQHFRLAQKDVEEIKISAEKAGNRALRLDRFEFDPDEAKLEAGDVGTFAELSQSGHEDS